MLEVGNLGSVDCYTGFWDAYLWSARIYHFLLRCCNSGTCNILRTHYYILSFWCNNYSRSDGTSCTLVDYRRCICKLDIRKQLKVFHRFWRLSTYKRLALWYRLWVDLSATDSTKMSIFALGHLSRITETDIALNSLDLVSFCIIY